MDVAWSGWIEEGGKWVNICRVGGYVATIQSVDVCEENGYRNRMWKVESDGALLATGYTLGSKHAYMFCELALYTAGVIEFTAMLSEAQGAWTQFNPRQ